MNINGLMKYVEKEINRIEMEYKLNGDINTNKIQMYNALESVQDYLVFF